MYLQCAQHARWEYVLAAGIDHDALYATGIGPVTLGGTVRCHRELRAGDELAVSCAFVWREGKTFRAEQKFRLGDGTPVAEHAASHPPPMLGERHMPTPASAPPVAQLVDPEQAETLGLPDGASIAFLTVPEEGAPCVMRGTIPPGGFVPLHSHADPETFLAVSGQVEGLAMRSPDDFTWIPIGPGDVFHVPGHAKHAWRNPSPEPFVAIIVSTAKLGVFFREFGTRVTAADGTQSPPSEAALRTLLEVARRYGHWNATPDENARVGVPMPSVLPSRRVSPSASG